LPPGNRLTGDRRCGQAAQTLRLASACQRKALLLP
jgi:hypothetical protein